MPDRAFYSRPDITPDTLGMTYPGVTFYPSNPDPGTVTHERIHQGQLKQSYQPSFRAAADALRTTMSPEEMLGYGGGVPWRAVMEGPASAFQLPKSVGDPRFLSKTEIEKLSSDQQEAYNRYIDLMYRLNGSNVDSIEAVAHPDYEMDYIRNHPRPYLAPDPKMKEVNIFTGK